MTPLLSLNTLFSEVVSVHLPATSPAIFPSRHNPAGHQPVWYSHLLVSFLSFLSEMIPAFVFVLTLILCMNVSGLELLLDHSNAMIVNIVLSQHFYVYVYVYECGN